MTDIQADDYGKLTDGSFVRARQRIGIPQVLRNPPHNFEVSEDGSRHFAFGYGDDNPLYCDPAYAKQTRWGNLIAPPTFQYTVGQNITEGNNAPVVPNFSKQLSINTRETVECFTDDLKFSLHGCLRLAVSLVLLKRHPADKPEQFLHIGNNVV